MALNDNKSPAILTCSSQLSADAVSFFPGQYRGGSQDVGAADTRLGQVAVQQLPTNTAMYAMPTYVANCYSFVPAEPTFQTRYQSAWPELPANVNQNVPANQQLPPMTVVDNFAFLSVPPPSSDMTLMHGFTPVQQMYTNTAPSANNTNDARHRSRNRGRAGYRNTNQPRPQHGVPIASAFTLTQQQQQQFVSHAVPGSSSGAPVVVPFNQFYSPMSEQVTPSDVQCSQVAIKDVRSVTFDANIVTNGQRFVAPNHHQSTKDQSGAVRTAGQRPVSGNQVTVKQQSGTSGAVAGGGQPADCRVNRASNGKSASVWRPNQPTRSVPLNAANTTPAPKLSTSTNVGQSTLVYCDSYTQTDFPPELSCLTLSEHSNSLYVKNTPHLLLSHARQTSESTEDHATLQRCSRALSSSRPVIPEHGAVGSRGAVGHVVMTAYPGNSGNSTQSGGKGSGAVSGRGRGVSRVARGGSEAVRWTVGRGAVQNVALTEPISSADSYPGHRGMDDVVRPTIGDVVRATNALTDVQTTRSQEVAGRQSGPGDTSADGIRHQSPLRPYAAVAAEPRKPVVRPAWIAGTAPEYPPTSVGSITATATSAVPSTLNAASSSQKALSSERTAEKPAGETVRVKQRGKKKKVPTATLR